MRVYKRTHYENINLLYTMNTRKHSIQITPAPIEWKIEIIIDEPPG